MKIIKKVTATHEMTNVPFWVVSRAFARFTVLPDELSQHEVDGVIWNAIKEDGLNPAETELVFVASHSMGGRRFTATPEYRGRIFCAFDPDFEHGDFAVLHKFNCEEIWFESATSESSLHAICLGGPDHWSLMLTVPADEETGKPYMGQYWTAFYEAAQHFATAEFIEAMENE
jgi:hypothetical protein